MLHFSSITTHIQVKPLGAYCIKLVNENELDWSWMEILMMTISSAAEGKVTVILARYYKGSAVIAPFLLTLLLIWLINDLEMEDHNQTVPGMVLNRQASILKAITRPW